MFASALETLRAGGPIAWLLLAMAFVMWSAAAARAWHLRRGFRGGLEELLRAQLRQPANAGEGEPIVLRFARRVRELPDAQGRARLLERSVDRTRVYAALLRALVMVAPLLGLLGTVSGMVDTFASLHESAVHDAASTLEAHLEERTVAGGISTALITTQLGLIVAIPSLVFERLLERRAKRRCLELARAHAVYEARVQDGGAP